MIKSLRSSSNLQGEIDWWSIVIYIALVALGWVNIYAAVYDDTLSSGFDMGQRYGMQLIWIGFSLVMAIVIMLVDDKYYHILAWPIYIFALLLMLSTLFLGRTVNGARAWIFLGPVAIQPVEFMKLATSLALARYMSGYSFSIHKFGNLLRIGLIIGIPVAIIVFIQNDTGSAIVYASFLLMLYREGLNKWVYIIGGVIIALFIGSFWIDETVLWALIIAVCALSYGLRYRKVKHSIIYLAWVALSSLLLYAGLNFVGATFYFRHALLVVTIVSLPVVVLIAYARRNRGIWTYIMLFVVSICFVSVTDFAFDHLQLHQQKRILGLLGIESDLQNWGYNVNQSKIAIGSGGFLGKGYLEGTQTKFNFVPEQSTDFIFCTVGEEWGFAGSVVVLTLFCLLVMRLIKMGERQQEPFSRIYCYCVAGIFFIHVLINVGMTIGLMPVIGIPLPFFSYGGSSLLAFSILFFIAVRLDMGSAEFDSR
jgi:rod shape determining protein RodA